METIYRAAEKGLTKMNCGSYYTYDSELAENYVCDGDELYSFDVELNFFDVTDFMDISDFDLGLTEIFELLEDEALNKDELLKNYDGFSIDCGYTKLLISFGKIEVNTNNVTKLSFEDMILEDEINEIIK